MHRPCRLAPTFAAVLAFSPAAAHNGDDHLLAEAQQVFKALPEHFGTPGMNLPPDRVALGRALFFEPRVSLDGKVSCATCHLPEKHGSDGRATSVGVEGRVMPRNAPTVLNAAGQFAQHYGGNRKDVEEQAMRALVSPLSYGNPDFAAAMAKLKALPEYGPQFAKAFPAETDPVTPENWGAAIGAYERTLTTPGRFDRYLAGDITALSGQARYGMGTFIKTGCAGCHSGPLLGGNSFRKFGQVIDYWQATGSPSIDPGRFTDTQAPADTYVFKVAPLRNVAKTAPYFHDGSVATLPEAVRMMALTQLGKKLAPEDVEDIVMFLEALTGDVPSGFSPP